MLSPSLIAPPSPVVRCPHCKWVTHSKQHQQQQVLYLSPTRGAAAAWRGHSLTSLIGGNTQAATYCHPMDFFSLFEHYVTHVFVFGFLSL